MQPNGPTQGSRPFPSLGWNSFFAFPFGELALSSSAQRGDANLSPKTASKCHNERAIRVKPFQELNLDAVLPRQTRSSSQNASLDAVRSSTRLVSSFREPLKTRKDLVVRKLGLAVPEKKEKRVSICSRAVGRERNKLLTCRREFQRPVGEGKAISDFRVQRTTRRERDELTTPRLAKSSSHDWSSRVSQTTYWRRNRRKSKLERDRERPVKEKTNLVAV